MINKKDITTETAKRSDDLTVYKVMAALLLLCVSLAGLRRLRKYYGTVGGMEVLDPLTSWIAIIGCILFAACIILLLLWKNRMARNILPVAALVTALIAVTGISMKMFWTQGFSSLYFLCCALFVQYIILQLYRWEFFLFSLCTISVGFTFFTMSGGFGWNSWSIVTIVLTVAILIATAVIAKLASKTGRILLGGKKLHLFPSSFNPTLLYLAAGLWLACLAAALLLGSLFAYYCMFAAIAVEFIAAVYYTFQLN